jgi:hypothetical protein
VANSHETMMAALVARLAAIQTPTNGAVYMPSVVKRVVFWPRDDYLKPEYDVVYLVRAGVESLKYADSQNTDADLEIFILAAKRFEAVDEDPFEEPSPSRSQIAADLKADIWQQLNLDTRLSGTAVDILQDTFVTNFDLYDPHWVLVELRFVVRYRYDRTTQR